MLIETTAWLIWVPVLFMGLACLFLWLRRLEFSADTQVYRELQLATQRGSRTARLQYPDIDLNQCIGCGLCIDACPESGVLELIHGQAVVVHGARCVGHGRCAEACPTNGIALTFSDLSTRRDLPVLADDLEAIGTQGLYLAGEVTGFALVKTAIGQGVAVANAAAKQIKALRDSNSKTLESVHDMVIVGAGPGGLACALRAKELGLDPLILEQEDRIGGTVAGYPRKKMVMTQPVHLPLFGRLPKLTYQKEELVELWERVSDENVLPIRFGHRLTQITRREDGLFRVETDQGAEVARTVTLALGRRGTPRKLNVEGEELDKVAYSLLDAESYRGKNILVVGGGDSAVEAAVGLSKQPGNQVTLSYRKDAFTRIKARNETALERALSQKLLTVLTGSQVISIGQDSVTLRQEQSEDTGEIELPNDFVFVFAGGIPPYELLERSGISFDPANRPAVADATGRSTGLSIALSLVFICTLAMAAWAFSHWDYYSLGANQRPVSLLHPQLRPSSLFGITFGIIACALFAWNLSYLIRKSTLIGRFLPGSLQFWMGSHVLTGMAAFLCVLVHAGFTMKNAAGGHALLALSLVVIAGCIGRYLYAFVPRAANGAELDLDKVRAQLTTLSSDWDRQGRGHGAQVRAQIDELVDAARWRPSLFSRIRTLVVGQIQLRYSLRKLTREGQQEGIPHSEIMQIQSLARRSYRLTLQVTHYEEIRSILSSWRYIHRWMALLMIVLVLIHIVTALRYANINWQPFMLWGQVQ